MGEDPAIFATALETLAVKAFGDMGQTARLRLIRDRFIAGHSSCELCRHLDSVPPEILIRDVVDRCHVWESHADPAVRRTSKPSPDPIYPAYVVGDADKISETTQGHQAVIIPGGTAPTTVATTATATRPTRLERSGVFLLWEVGSCSNKVPELGRILSVYAARMAGGENTGGIYYDPTPGGDGPSAGGKWRLIREEGFSSRGSGHVRPRDPGWGGGGGQCRLFPHDG